MFGVGSTFPKERKKWMICCLKSYSLSRCLCLSIVSIYDKRKDRLRLQPKKVFGFFGVLKRVVCVCVCVVWLLLVHCCRSFIVCFVAVLFGLHFHVRTYVRNMGMLI